MNLKIDWKLIWNETESGHLQYWNETENLRDHRGIQRACRGFQFHFSIGLIVSAANKNELCGNLKRNWKWRRAILKWNWKPQSEAPFFPTILIFFSFVSGCDVARTTHYRYQSPILGDVWSLENHMFDAHASMLFGWNSDLRHCLGRSNSNAQRSYIDNLRHLKVLKHASFRLMFYIQLSLADFVKRGEIVRLSQLHLWAYLPNEEADGSIHGPHSLNQ